MVNYPTTFTQAIDEFKQNPVALSPNLRFYKSLKGNYHGHRIYGMPTSANSKSLSYFIDTGSRQNQNKIVVDIASNTLKTLSQVAPQEYAADRSLSSCFKDSYPILLTSHRGVYRSDKGIDKYYLITDYGKPLAKIEDLDEQQKWDLARDIVEAVVHMHDNYCGHLSILPENIQIFEVNPLRAKLGNCLQYVKPVVNQNHFQLGRFLFGLFVNDSLRSCQSVSSEFYSETKPTLHRPIDRLILELFNPYNIELSFFQERFMHLFITRNRPTYALTDSERTEVLLPRPILEKCRRVKEMYRDQFTVDVKRLADRSMSKKMVEGAQRYLFKKNLSSIAVMDTGIELGKGKYKRVMKAFDLETGAIKALAISETPECIDPETADVPLALPSWSNTLRDKYYTVTNAFECRDLYHILSWCDFLLQQTDKFRIARDLIDGLQYLHRRDFVHQDLKTENVFSYFDEHGRIRVKLGDFGYLTTTDLPSRHGNILYSSPEKLRNVLIYPESNDTYGLGVILYELFIDKYEVDRIASIYFPKGADAAAASPKYAEHCLSICQRNYDNPIDALIVKIMHPYHEGRMSLRDFDKEFRKLYP